MNAPLISDLFLYAAAAYIALFFVGQAWRILVCNEPFWKWFAALIFFTGVLSSIAALNLLTTTGLREGFAQMILTAFFASWGLLAHMSRKRAVIIAESPSWNYMGELPTE